MDFMFFGFWNHQGGPAFLEVSRKKQASFVFLLLNVPIGSRSTRFPWSTWSPGASISPIVRIVALPARNALIQDLVEWTRFAWSSSTSAEASKVANLNDALRVYPTASDNNSTTSPPVSAIAAVSAVSG